MQIGAELFGEPAIDGDVEVLGLLLSALAAAGVCCSVARAQVTQPATIRLGVLAYRGTLVSVGAAARSGSAIEATSLWTRNNTLRGVFLGGAILPETLRWLWRDYKLPNE